LVERTEAASGPLAAGPAPGEDREHRLAEVRGKLSDERGDEPLARQPLAPERRARATGLLSDPLERETVPAVLAEHRDRCLVEARVDGRLSLHPYWFAHATRMLHNRDTQRKSQPFGRSRRSAFRGGDLLSRVASSTDEDVACSFRL